METSIHVCQDFKGEMLNFPVNFRQSVGSTLGLERVGLPGLTSCREAFI